MELLVLARSTSQLCQENPVTLNQREVPSSTAATGAGSIARVLPAILAILKFERLPTSG